MVNINSWWQVPIHFNGLKIEFVICIFHSPLNSGNLILSNECHMLKSSFVISIYISYI